MAASNGGKYLPPPDYDPRVISKMKGVDESNIGYVKPAVDAFSQLYVSLQRLSDAREAAKKNGAWNTGQQILAVSREAEKLEAAALRAFDGAHARLRDGIKSIDESLSKPLQSRADATLSREVREHVKGLSADKRHTFISERIDKGDSRTVEAILGAQGFLSGLDDNFIETYTRTWHQKNQPELVQRLDVMSNALGHLERKGVLIQKEVEKCLGASWQTVAELKKAQGDAERMLALVNAPLQEG